MFMENTVRPRLLALALSAALLALLSAACGGREQARQNPFKTPANVAKPATTDDPAVNVFEDEATIRGSQSVVAGTVRNVSGRTLEGLFVELELSRRGADAREVRRVAVEPATVEHGAEGRYAVRLSNREWAGSKLLRVGAGAGGEELAFVAQPGARRPPERTPDGKIIVVRKPRTKGDDFLNSPDEAVPIR